MKEPVAIIKDGKVVNAEQLKRYWRDENERRYLLRKAVFAILPSIEMPDLNEKPHYPPAPPEHRLMDKLNQLEGLANNTRLKLQKHLNEKRRDKYIIR